MGVLQGLAVREVKAIADTFLRNGVPTATSEAVRTALQGLVGCAGAAPTGNCASGALGAASSVVLNNLIRELSAPRPRDPITNQEIPLSLADQQSRTALIATLTGAIAGALGANAGVASNAGVIETENNDLYINGRLESLTLIRNPTLAQREEARRRVTDYFANNPAGKLALQAAGGDQALAERCLVLPGATGAGCGAVQTRANELSTAAALAASATIVARVNFYDIVRTGGAILNSAGEAIGYIDTNYGQIVTRGLGVAQGAAGAFEVVAGAGTVAVGLAACPVTVGSGCGAAVVGAGVVVIGVDNIYAGISTTITGRYTPTFGARQLSSLTGLSIETTELLYGFSTFGVSTLQGGLQRLVRNSAARAQTRIANETLEAAILRAMPITPVGVPLINVGRQGKHIVGDNNFIPGRSVLTADPQTLAPRAGSGVPANSISRGQSGFKERVDFGRIIGNYVSNGRAVPTTNGIIVYDKAGMIHIYPVRPNQ